VRRGCAALDGIAGLSAGDPAIAVAVSTYQRPELLPRLIAALEAQTLEPERFEVVIVDNGSADDTFAVLERLAARSPLRLRPLRLEQNRGPAGARNAAWRATTAPFVACTDDDCAPDPEWLEQGLRTLASSPEVGVVQGRTAVPLDADEYGWTDWTVYRDIRGLTPWFEGCNLFFRREALEATGGYDESIGWFGEETALGWSVLAAGWERRYEDAAVVRHDLSERGFGYHAKQRYLEGNMVTIARRFPALRHEGFWRPWAVHRQNLEFAMFAAGVVLAPTRLPRSALALALTLPWLRRRGPSRRHSVVDLGLLGPRIVVDAAALAGMLRASARERILVI
jgi:glycosyltransferase involved in cell wall biosynthesis